MDSDEWSSFAIKFLLAIFFGMAVGPNHNRTVTWLMAGTLALIGIIMLAAWWRWDGRWA
jgi:hypothetical protein